MLPTFRIRIIRTAFLHTFLLHFLGLHSHPSVGETSINKGIIYIFRARCSAVIVGNTVVAIGGCSEDERCEEINLKTVEYLVLGENSWKRLPSMHCGRAGAAACFLP